MNGDEKGFAVIEERYGLHPFRRRPVAHICERSELMWEVRRLACEFHQRQ
jgi:hypothetical protein